MLRPHWEGFRGRKGSSGLGALSRDHLGEGGEGRNRGPVLLGEEKHRVVPGTGPPALSSTYLASL